MSSTLTYQQDFPVAFAEEVEDSSASTEFYINWLEDSTEFPVLSSSAAINDGNYTSGNWELLQRKDIMEDEGPHVLVPAEEEEEWSKLNEVEKEELYSKIIEKNAKELQPKHYTIRPLWSNNNKASNVTTDDGDEEYEDDDSQDDNLGAELVDTKKSQSRRTSRLSNRRRIHDLKAVDIHVQGIYKIVTQEGAKFTTADGTAIKWGYPNRSDKANALAMCAQYSHGMKHKAKDFDPSNKKVSQNQISEYNIYSKITDKNI